MFSYMYCTISCEAYRTVHCRMPTIHLMANLIPDKSKLKYQDHRDTRITIEGISRGF